MKQEIVGKAYTVSKQDVDALHSAVHFALANADSKSEYANRLTKLAELLDDALLANIDMMLLPLTYI